MKVYDGSSWGEVTSTGDFKFLVPVDAGTTTAATWDGSDTSFDLKETTNTGSAASVTSVYQLMISVNGVIQKPNTGSWSGSGEGFYLTDSDTIRFATAPPTGSSVFVIQFGSALNATTPADNTVATAKIQNLAVTTAKIAADAVDGTKLADDAVAQEHIADEAVDEARIQISNAGSNGQFLSKQSGNTGGLTWATVAQGTPTDITVADESTDTSCNVLFVTAATGDLAPKTGTNLTFNSNTGALGATSYTGDGSALTGVAAASADGCMYKNTLTISNAHTIAATEGAHSVGPITLNNTVTVNGRWVIS